MTEKTTHRIQLRPTRTELEAAPGTPLRGLLFEQGVEFPCGGQGRCRGCRVQVLEGSAAITPLDRERLSAEELGAGWRLACQCAVEGDLVIELRQWDAVILGDDTPFAFRPRSGLGVALDVGTTTLVGQLLDLATGRVLAVHTALNAPARYGADVMSRIQHALEPEGRRELEKIIRAETGAMVRQLLASAQVPKDTEISDVVLVGNTAMHHLFCGIDVDPLSHFPFQPVRMGLQVFRARQLGWEAPGDPQVRFLPCLGGFVGSDVLAGVLATGLSESEEVAALVDLGTNGEIVVGDRRGLLCASTAAGPAFEGARISMGMRAASGAVSQAAVEGGGLRCTVLGQTDPRGLCGSGLVDVVAAGLDLGVINPSGQLTEGGGEWKFCPPVSLTQRDIRELQLAKGAIAAGMKILKQRRGAAKLARLYLAGAFGNYVSRASAYRIGLIDFPPQQVQPAGNTALRGAKLALFAPDGEDGSYAALRSRVEHVTLSSDPHFQDLFVDALRFPERTQTFSEGA